MGMVCCVSLLFLLLLLMHASRANSLLCYSQLGRCTYQGLGISLLHTHSSFFFDISARGVQQCGGTQDLVSSNGAQLFWLHPHGCHYCWQLNWLQRWAINDRMFQIQLNSCKERLIVTIILVRKYSQHYIYLLPGLCRASWLMRDVEILQQ